MKPSSAPLLICSFAALLIAQTDVQAGFVSWSYNWSRVPNDVISADANGTSRISLSDETAGHAVGSSDIVATNLKTFSDTPVAKPNKFLNSVYNLTLRLTDDASGETGSLTFAGAFNGSLSKASASIRNRFTGATSGVLELGDNEYTVTLGDYSPPGPPRINNAGSIAASVEVRSLVTTPLPDPDPIPPAPNDAPEPSTIVLSGLAASFLGMVSWWRRGRKTQPTVA